MARGLFSGLVWGGILGAIGIASLSLMHSSRPLIGTVPPIAGTQAPIGSVATGEDPAIAIGASSDAATGAATPTALTEPGNTQPPGQADPLGQIEVGDITQTLPGTVSDGDGLQLSAMAGEDASPDAASPASVGSVPLGEAVPETGVQPEMPDAQTEGVASATSPDGGQTVPTSPATDVMPNEATPDPAGAALSEAQPDAQAPPAAQPVRPPRSTQPDAGSDTPGVPAGQIGDLAQGVTTGRLPSIGASSDDAQASPVSPAPLSVRDPALLRNAQSFENVEGQPLMAVILMDIGAARTMLGDLKNLPFPISFIVDADAPDAAEAIAFYRSSGAEIVVSVPFPEGVTPADVEVTLAVYAPLLEDAVAMMAPKESGFQTLGASATQVGVVLQATGHGLISIPQGLNTGHKSARKEGVAVGLIFRELDNDGQSGVIIRRFMDNAAFKAGQNEGVILLGHARIETIQALIEWSLGSRAKSVALAPVSAVLSGG